MRSDGSPPRAPRPSRSPSSSSPPTPARPFPHSRARPFVRPSVPGGPSWQDRHAQRRGRSRHPPISGHAPAGALTRIVATTGVMATAIRPMRRLSRRRRCLALAGFSCQPWCGGRAFAERPFTGSSLLEDFNECAGNHRAPSGQTRGSRSWVRAAGDRAGVVSCTGSASMAAMEPWPGPRQKGQSRTKPSDGATQ